MLKGKLLNAVEIIIIVGIATFPLLLSFPFRVNIFLSWEGAYRMSEGQVPFRDFGIPLGGMYWVVPALFFKIFGAQLITLVKAQAFINIISGLAFRYILLTLSVNPIVRVASVLLYAITFSFFNFWPWYNHSAIVYGLIATAFVIHAILRGQGRKKIFSVLMGALFVFLSFFTKQDGGGLFFFLCVLLLLYDGWVDNNWKIPLFFVGGIGFLFGIILTWFSSYDFSYWFNHGQPPHNSRVSVTDILNELLSESQWIKFYLLIILLIVIVRIRQVSSFFRQKNEVVFVLLTLGILGLAAIFQITSYTPVMSNIFFHSFAFAFIFHYLFHYLNIEPSRKFMLAFLCCGIMIWWSHMYWGYVQRVFIRKDTAEGEIAYSKSGENIVSLHNARLKSKKKEDGNKQEKWLNSDLKTLKRIKLPESTIHGINRFLEKAREKQEVRVLNMSELTFLAKEVPYTLERGPKFPLWYHLGVGMFNREAKMFEERIATNYYDFVLFEYLPGLNNFYPFRVRDSLQVHYDLIDEFAAPRSSESGTIEVYRRK